ncbi:MAG: hypothetical protein JW754_04120 [Candidatus Aenigmarchaeota archaeon]|nr:hypothetical protein [Candidatus Aenigmarchaeota archaeon]
MPAKSKNATIRPKDDVVIFILKKILKKHCEIESQKRLRDFVVEDLKRVEPRYSISGERIRRICVKTPGIYMKIHTRKGKAREKCPSCGHSLQKSFTKNLKGKKFLVKASCHKCGYKSSAGKWIPSKYEFRIR